MHTNPEPMRASRAQGTRRTRPSRKSYPSEDALRQTLARVRADVPILAVGMLDRCPACMLLARPGTLHREGCPEGSQEGCPDA